MTRTILNGLRELFKSEQPPIIYPSSGTGAAEAALVNCLSPGDTVIAFDGGFFAAKWARAARDLGLRVVMAPADWEHAIDTRALRETLAGSGRDAKALLVVHSETSTGLLAPVEAIRAVLDELDHPALLLVDAVSSLGVMDYQHDRWGVDVTITSSQKGLMLPPGLGFNAVSARALSAGKQARLARSYWSWEPILHSNADGFFPYTTPITLLAGLRESLAMIAEETGPARLARHAKLAAAARLAVGEWEFGLLAPDQPHSNAVTVFWLPPGYDGDRLVQVIARDFGIWLGRGLGPLSGRVLRIGHLGHVDEQSLAAGLAALDAAFRACGVVSHHGRPPG